MKNRKVLFFTHRLVGGGAEKTIINLSEYINKNVRGWDAYICVVYNDISVAQTLVSKVIDLGIATSPEMNKLRKIPIVINQAMRLKKLKRELDIETCVSFLPGSDFLNVLSKGKEKVIISVRNKESFFVKSWMRKLYLKFCYVKADAIVAISQRVEHDICHTFGVKKDKVQTIYNPDAEFVFTDNIPEWYRELVSEKQVIITAGRLTLQKGQGYLIRAFKEVHINNPNTHLVILGQGELRQELQNLVSLLGLENAVTFGGFVHNPYDYIVKAKIFVFSSIVEGLGNVLVETLKCKTPIISTDCDCGPREILAPESLFSYSTKEIEFAEYGVLVPVCQGDYMNNLNESSWEEKILSEAILKLLEDEERMNIYKEKSGKRLESFKIDKIVSEWMEVINKVV